MLKTHRFRLLAAPFRLIVTEANNQSTPILPCPGISLHWREAERIFR